MMDINIKKIILFLIFILSIFNFKFSSAKIIYNKNDSLITEYDIQIYSEYYENIFKKEINNDQAIKNLVLINKTVSFLKINNLPYLEQLDILLSKKYKNELIKNEIVLNMLRFLEIRNDFIINYFNNNLKLSDIETAIKFSDNFVLTYSSNECLTIEDKFDYKNYPNFSKLIYENLKNLDQKIKIIIGDISYQLCFGSKERAIIEESLFNIIERKTKKDFDKFLYNAYKK